MSTDRQLQYTSYHQQTSRNVLAALYESEPPRENGAVPAAAPDDADSAGLSCGESEPRVRRTRQPANQLGRSRDELSRREEQDNRQWESTEQAEVGRRQMEVTESDRRSARAAHSQERDTWRENRRQHQSSQILLGFGSATPRWESSTDMGRRYVEFWSRPVSPVTSNSRLPPRCTSSSQLDAAGQRAPLDALRRSSLRRSSLRVSSSMSELVCGGDSHRETLDRGRGQGWARDRSAGTDESSARRHRSDLTPTAPGGQSFRDPPPPRHRSPGKAVSMSRLDQLARPRRPLVVRHEAMPPAPPSRMWQSMWHLGPVQAPRPTRAMLLRRAARDRPGAPETGVSGGSSSSRPPSALSQQSGATGGARASPLRLRVGARRPRPSSIAGMPSRPATDAARQEAEASRVPSRSGSASTPRRPLPASAPTSEARRPPPTAGTASPRRTPAQVKADDARKKKQRSKSGTPQPSESRAAVSQQAAADTHLGSSVGSEHSISPAPSGGSAEGASEQPRDGSTEPPRGGATEPPRGESPAITVRPASPQPAPSAPTEQTEGSTPGRKAGYDSEAAARAALAEKRRQAREEAERQAELERQRLEEQERQEQERLRQEEQMMEEAARAEQERLQRAIQEAEERRAAEERQRQEEEQLRLQREEEEAAARLEAERARIAAAEKLQREEAERKQRRSRVAAIMSRTRNNNNDAPEKTLDSEGETTGSVAQQTADSKGEDESTPAVSELKAAPAHQEGAPKQNQDQEQDQELPMSTSSSPAPNITNGTNGLDDSAEPTPSAADDGHSNGVESDGHSNGSLLSPLHSLVLKPAAAGDDEDSLNSNVSPQPSHVSLGPTGGPPPELGHAVHTTELVQL